MSQEIDPGAFKAAMMAAGVDPSSKITVPKWLDVWEGYTLRRKGRLDALTGGVGQLISAFLDRLRGFVDREREAKAELAELDHMRRDALALGGDAELLARIARQRGRLKAAAEWAAYDAEATRRAAIDLGITLKETDR